MRHVLPPNPIKKAFVKPKSKRNLLGRRKRQLADRRALLMQDHYAPRQVPSVPRYLKIVILVIAAILIVQSIFQIPLFRINDVKITGLKYLAEEEVYQFVYDELGRRRWIFFKNNNYFLHASGRLQKRLEEEYYVEVVQLDKNFPHGLTLEIEERIAGFVLQKPDQYIQIDTLGEWVGEVVGPQGNQAIIADEREIVGAVIPLQYLERATDIKDKWDNIVPQVLLNKFHLNDDESMIQVSTDKGFRVYFSPEKDLEQQLRRLAIFLQETGIDEPREYIDLRFDESLYIR